MARIMVIAGGTWQCPIVQLAKKKGHEVICSNLYADSPAFAYADTGLVADVRDLEKNLAYAKKYQPDAVLTDQTDLAVPTVAFVAEQMGLRGIPVTIAKRFTNKYQMRVHTERAGYASPGYSLLRQAQDAAAFLKKYPRSILKPLDSQSSRGIFIVESMTDVERHFYDCMQYSHSEKAVLIEEYIDGVEFTVDGILTEQGYVVTAISEKEHYPHNPNVAKRLFFSQESERYDYDRLRRQNAAFVRDMGLPFGMTHAEYKYRDGEFYLIEIAARGGGTRISSDLVPLMSGLDANSIYLDLLLDRPAEMTVGKKHACAVLGFFDFASGRVVQVSGLEEACRQEGVRDAALEIHVGDVLTHPSDDRSRCGYYIIYADSPKELAEREQRLMSTVKVVTEP